MQGRLIHGMRQFLLQLCFPFWAWSHCHWGVGAKCRASPSARRRDAPDTSGRLTSISVQKRGSRALLRSSWRAHRWSGRSVFTVVTSTVDSQVALNTVYDKNARDKTFANSSSLYWGKIFAKFNFANHVRSPLQEVVGGSRARLVPRWESTR